VVCLHGHMCRFLSCDTSFFFIYKYNRMNGLSVAKKTATVRGHLRHLGPKRRRKSGSVATVATFGCDTRALENKGLNPSVAVSQGGDTPSPPSGLHIRAYFSSQLDREIHTFLPSLCIRRGPSSIVRYLRRSLNVFESIARQFLCTQRFKTRLGYSGMRARIFFSIST